MKWLLIAHILFNSGEQHYTNLGTFENQQICEAFRDTYMEMMPAFNRPEGFRVAMACKQINIPQETYKRT